MSIRVCLYLWQIFEGVVNLLDKLQAWHTTPGSGGAAELKEISLIGLRIITGYIQQQQNPQVHTYTSDLLGIPGLCFKILVFYLLIMWDELNNYYDSFKQNSKSLMVLKLDARYTPFYRWSVENTHTVMFRIIRYAFGL